MCAFNDIKSPGNRYYSSEYNDMISYIGDISSNSYRHSSNTIIHLTSSSEGLFHSLSGQAISGGVVQGTFGAGTRQLLTFSKTSVAVDSYLGAAALGTTATYGFVMPRNGSIISMSVCYNATQTTPGDIITYVKVNDINSLSKTTTTNGTAVYTDYVTQSRNINTFTAGQYITMYVDFVTFTGTVSPTFGLVEIQFDT